MRKFLCKVFRFLLDLVSQLVELIANTLIKIGTAAVEVLSEVAGTVGSAIAKNPLVWAAIGIGAFFLLPKLLGGAASEDEKRPKVRQQIEVQRNANA